MGWRQGLLKSTTTATEQLLKMKLGYILKQIINKMKMKNTITITLLSFILSFSSAFSQEIGKHSVYLGISPFGGGINLGHNLNEKTSVNVGFGGAPEGDIPDAIKPEIDGFSDNYTHTAKSAWMGMFVSHQPLDQFNWFRVNAGFAVGPSKTLLRWRMSFIMLITMKIQSLTLV